MGQGRRGIQRKEAFSHVDEMMTMMTTIMLLMMMMLLMIMSMILNVRVTPHDCGVSLFKCGSFVMNNGVRATCNTHLGHENCGYKFQSRTHARTHANKQKGVEWEERLKYGWVLLPTSCTLLRMCYLPKQEWDSSTGSR
jgi:hypothetical protein